MSSVILRLPAPLRSALAALVCVAALLPLSRAEAEPGIRILNSLSTADLAFNALTTNSGSIDALTSQALTSRAFAGDWRLKHQLEDPAARNVMHYLVECALAPTSKVEWKDRLGNVYIFAGGAALCPEWEFTAPSPQCLGYVSACLLSRNNAYGHTVEISLRGEDPRDDLRFNPTGDTKQWHPMFLPCDKGGSGLGDECGWVGEGVGACTPGLEVTVAAGAPRPDTCTGLLGASSGHRVLRVCEKPWGCEAGDALAAAEKNDCGGDAPSATFKCPRGGRYSIMSAPFNRMEAPGSWVRPGTTHGRYPVASFGAFTFREGAFFGNIFDSKALSVEVSINMDTYLPQLSKPNFTGYPYQNVHACFAKDWIAGDVHLASRICANTTIGDHNAFGCLARTVGPCEFGSASPQAPRCAVGDGFKVQGDGDFEVCSDDDGVFHPEPITTYLNSPCDALPVTDRNTCGSTECDLSVSPPMCKKGCAPRSASECLAVACVKNPKLCAKQ
ncbi:hypothetical protein FJV41_00805 [Myxococcus llanfairpwllgwyngyllgogerychwyrndrobwllllantysiliogogogochensis]|uniref:Uncharacterized protein n=1 Tax=Myxococcus llanfairpwllgwyngyllgogerychwyrndrobwllllantysiliogogogochensis TaxID=2590453 RepID=A0A540X9H6_9BACT|nr:hypothetical protein [Myxococcus llanfairpwllgwyngyllgogerychwyrndrobwllllantysiliogogogochensis]TQF17917.1 hypothetical protein FJV41_00805 [Myxococcus llanfairpwllgwyngyllgogerychwyrndrobwllllantysiliogogogochensis]